MIENFLTIVFGTIVIFPFIMSFFFYSLNRWTKYKISIRKNADYTTPFLFLSVCVIMSTLFGGSSIYFIFIGILVLILLYAIFEKRNVKDFQISVLLRKVWRLLFILLTMAYLLLIIVGLTITIIQSITS